jgi:hypothetical protein
MQNQNNNEVKLYSDTIGLTYRPTCVIYKGKKFDAPVFLTTLQSWDLIAGWLGTGEYKKWLK